MVKYQELSREQLEAMLVIEQATYESFVKEKLNIDISRGKPCNEQLDLSNELLTIIKELPKTPDIRNYGGLEGMAQLRELFATIIGVPAGNVIIGGNSSLTMMYDTVQRAMQFGCLGEKPWNKYDKIKFLCPVPGYDRHFSICQIFGIEMIAIPMDSHGPNMDIVEELVAADSTVKGMWCVPKYSNPTGITYSDEVVDRLAKMYTAAKDFRIFWDNAYAIHDLYEEKDQLKNIFTVASEVGNENRVFLFTSTSKVTFSGAGVACMAMSANNCKDALRVMTMQTIGPDKVNQYAHYMFLKNYENIVEHMKKHANILRPKFETVLCMLERDLGDSDIAKWTKPRGGYFISYDVLNGCARRVGELCKAAGLVITAVGATYPLGLDDSDSNIRIAPTYTNGADLAKSMGLLICSTKIACIEKILGRN